MGNDGGGAHTSDRAERSVRRVPRILTGGGRVSRVQPIWARDASS